MPNKKPRAGLSPEVKNHEESKAAPASREPPGRSPVDPVALSLELLRITELVDSGRMAEAEKAATLFVLNLQPFIIAYPTLLSECVRVLRRCGAGSLLRRFLLTANYDAPRGSPSRAAE